MKNTPDSAFPRKKNSDNIWKSSDFRYFFSKDHFNAYGRIKKIRVGRPAGTTHTFHLSLSKVANGLVIMHIDQASGHYWLIDGHWSIEKKHGWCEDT